MKILHTADIHIKDVNDERWQALAVLIDLACQEQVAALVISGDLFESETAANLLRPHIRDLFSNLPFRVLMIAGNHDANAYPEGIYFGDSVSVLRDLAAPVAIGDVVFWGFPYAEMREEDVLDELYRVAPLAAPDKTHVLLFHGELLDISGGWEMYGDEGRQRYLPVKLSYFRELPWRYVLAGHFHSNFDVHEFAEGAYFVYPGSPISITRKETGVRKVNRLRVGRPPEAVVLPTPYYVRVEVRLSPFDQQNPIDLIAERVKGVDDHARLLLDIGGYFNGKQQNLSEQELQRAVNTLAGRPVDTVTMAFRDIRDIVEDDLFRLFLERLKSSSYEPAEKNRILDITLQAMMEIAE